VRAAPRGTQGSTRAKPQIRRPLTARDTPVSESCERPIVESRPCGVASWARCPPQDEPDDVDAHRLRSTWKPSYATVAHREDLRVVRCRVHRGRLVPRRPDHLRVAGRSSRLALAQHLSRMHCPCSAGRAVSGLATGVLLGRAELVRVRAEHTARVTPLFRFLGCPRGVDLGYGQPHRKDPQVVGEREEALTAPAFQTS
jgi:hypothetical protein